ncbi:MAG: MBL fold metallo-hydrolase [Dehalococcoidales bacterium]|nr:MBL fold metallo-hydrolase [Dehalococcoidales bacterium]
MNIRFLGAHNTESRDTGLSGLLIDNALALDAGGLTSSLTLTEQLGLKAVLITHQHYDHIKDLPLLAMNRSLNNSTLDVYCLAGTGEAISKCLMDGTIYPEFLKKNKEGKSVINMCIVKPYLRMQVDNYFIVPVPVPHSVPAVGYRVTAVGGNSFFYTGDTGPGLADCWERVSSKLLITEVTASDKYVTFCRDTEHMCPCLLKEELLSHLNVKGYLPNVIAVHMNHAVQEDIKSELKALADELDITITMAFEGKHIEI